MAGLEDSILTAAAEEEAEERSRVEAPGRPSSLTAATTLSRVFRGFAIEFVVVAAARWTVGGGEMSDARRWRLELHRMKGYPHNAHAGSQAMILMPCRRS